MNDVVGGVLARAVALSGVQLHGFVVLSNHVHLLVTAKGASLSGFMQYFLGNVARKVGRLHDWTCALWERRFSAELVLDDAAAEERLAYILSNGVKEGLVDTPAEWPGLTCHRMLRDEAVATFHFFHWARRWVKGELLPGADAIWDTQWAEEVSLRLTPLPSWSALSLTHRRERVDAMVRDIVEAPREDSRPVLGVDGVLRQDPHARPERTARSPRPLCHAASPQLRRKYQESCVLWNAAYAAASHAFRLGRWEVEFPPWAFRPPIPPLPEDESFKACGT